MPSNGDGVSRRTVLKSSASFVGAYGLTVTSENIQGSVRDDDSVEIVYAKQGDNPHITKEVPRRWKDDSLKAQEGVEELQSRFLENSDVFCIGISTRDESIGGLNLKSIEIHSKEDSITSNIPEEINGIPVNITTGVGDIEGLACTGDIDPLEAGVNTNSAHVEGTLGARVEHNSERYLYVSRHIFTYNEICSTYDPEGDPAYQNEDYIGDVANSGTGYYDSLLVEFDESNSSRSGTTAQIIGQAGVICGHLAKTGIDYIASNNIFIDGKGKTSCDMSHRIDSYDNNIYDQCSNRTFSDMIFTDSVAQSGDSGGPWYDYNQWDDEILMSHHTAGAYDVDGDDNYDVTFGAAAYALHGNLGYRFDTASDLQCS